MTNEQIEAVATAIGGTTDFDGDRMASRYTDSELCDMATAAIAAMPDRYAEGYAAAKAQAERIADDFKYADPVDDKRDDDSRSFGYGVDVASDYIAQAIANMEPGA